ncbi:MAG: AAA family ATPase [Bacilli bacterium]|nr:AAA family ATPase [Bacilli bacterium]MDD4734218.1 AAA family ATPase [Bacilli bacterium]
MKKTFDNDKLIDLNYIVGKNNDSVKKFLYYNGVSFNDDDICVLSDLIVKINENNRYGLNVSYTVNRINKEFDLVKIGNNSLVNIELKKCHTSENIKQLKQNCNIFSEYYTGYDINLFCYELEDSKLYYYEKSSDELIESNYIFMNEKLSLITEPQLLNINVNVVSVYLKPKLFLEGKYILSNSQEKAKEQIIASSDKFLMVLGRAGTGKTLLALDLYKYYTENGLSAIVITPFMSEKIIPVELRKVINFKKAKDFNRENETYDIVIVDEAQRLGTSDINSINKNSNTKVIFLGDTNQCIDGETSLERFLEENMIRIINMNQIIRTDNTFDMFARKVLNIPARGFKKNFIDVNRIEIIMYDKTKIDDYIDYQFIEPSKSPNYENCIKKCRHKECENIGSKVSPTIPHFAISKEYPKVLMFLCDGYKIDNGKIIQTKKVCYGYLRDHIYSIITRATEKLVIMTTDIEVYNFLNDKKKALLQSSLSEELE